MKVLMVAYACEPGTGSEPGIGWNWALQAARHHEVWVIAREAVRPNIEAAVADRPVPSLHFVYLDVPRPWAYVLHHKFNGGYLHYYVWQYFALQRARRLHSQLCFDVAHHVTYGGVRFPSFLFALGVPYLWGPIGGSDSAPPAFLSGFGLAGNARQLVRYASNFLLRYDPLLRATARRAAVIAAVTPATRKALPRWAQAKTVLEPQIALDANEVGEPPAPRLGDGLRVVFMGRLLYWKGLDLAIRAIAHARVRGLDVTYTIIGEGPEDGRLRELVARLRLQDAVSFLGSMPREAVLNLLSEQDCMLFPSLQDSGGFAVLEGMAAGLPVICLDIGGPALSVTDESGIRVPARKPRQVVEDLSDALLRLAGDQDLRHQMGVAAQDRIRASFLWDNKADVLVRMYKQVQESAS